LVAASEVVGHGLWLSAGGRLKLPMDIDVTHAADLRSWVPSADAVGTPFPIQNLPFGRFRRRETNEPWRIGVAIGDLVLDLRLARDTQGWTAEVEQLLVPLADGDLNAFMSLGTVPRRRLRRALSAALLEGSDQQDAVECCLVAQTDIEMSMPCRVGDYTDFFTGIYHATRAGQLFRPDNPLLPNYKWVPIGYHGRASSLVPSGHPVHRPNGQTKSSDSAVPSFGPSRRLDYELELGYFVGLPNPHGTPVSIEQAKEHLFGVVLLNDWSARDIQAWEYQPLGPFMAKNFASTVSPWLVTWDALEPFRAPLLRPDADPAPLPYLYDQRDMESGLFEIQLKTWIQTAAMRTAGNHPICLATSSASEASYWTPAQLVTHHTSNGCNLQSGDLLGSGTLSGPLRQASGSLLELTEGGTVPVHLPNGEKRLFLEDGDQIVLEATCHREGFRSIGLGTCAAEIGSALPLVAHGMGR
jgi:fumarylacetoacetase